MTSTMSTSTPSASADDESGTHTLRRPPGGALTVRPRARPGDEAYLRSEMTQAAIDIAAGR
ncbi:hypothetical protein ABIB25_003571 [Nakamurella sp. UYEF19]|uniref:hypothetical protein n=1 Tax=Nakamurella sp. UYEF19 TaxID=1756392 RepID=UPI003395BA0C